MKERENWFKSQLELDPEHVCFSNETGKAHSHRQPDKRCHTGIPDHCIHR